jgi:hypothetical protein
MCGYCSERLNGAHTAILEHVAAQLESRYSLTHLDRGEVLEIYARPRIARCTH